MGMVSQEGHRVLLGGVAPIFAAFVFPTPWVHCLKQKTRNPIPNRDKCVKIGVQKNDFKIKISKWPQSVEICMLLLSWLEVHPTHDLFLELGCSTAAGRTRGGPIVFWRTPFWRVALNFRASDRPCFIGNPNQLPRLWQTVALDRRFGECSLCLFHPNQNLDGFPVGYAKLVFKLHGQRNVRDNKGLSK